MDPSETEFHTKSSEHPLSPFQLCVLTFPVILQYYKAKSRYDSVANWVQKRSRAEWLKPLLVKLGNASISWPAEQAKQ